jgi:hypothetical protein
MNRLRGVEWRRVRTTIVALLGLISALHLSSCSAHPASTQVSPSSIDASRLAVAPTPVPSPTPILDTMTPGEEATRARMKALASRVGTCAYAQSANIVGGRLYVGCTGGLLAVFDVRGHALGSAHLPMYGVNGVVRAGSRAIAVYGYNDGAALRGELRLLRIDTLAPIVKHSMADSTFLGAIGDRAYIDDWCCNGRADVYEPATIYSVSLKDGSESTHVDLAPDPQAHPGNEQPLGQGANNYLIGSSLYVVVGPVTYRYDVNALQKAPERFATPGASPAPSAR